MDAVLRRVRLVIAVVLALGVAIAGIAATGGAGRARARGATEARVDAGAGAALASFPVTVRDDLGRDVVVPREPLRIVSLLPSHTETLYALGVGDRLVARDDFSDYPEQAKAVPAVGGIYDASIEAIVALLPDLVLTAGFASQPAALERAGLVVWAGSSESYDDAFATFEAIGRLTGREDAARALEGRVRADVAAEEARAARSPRVRVYYEIDASPYAASASSFLGVLLAKAGGDDIVPGKLGPFPQIDPELVLDADPDVILGATLDDVRARPGWSRLRAVQSGRASSLSPAERSVVARPGPRMAEAVRILSARLHP
jgi:iron complex transport system substrate-binding protein